MTTMQTDAMEVIPADRGVISARPSSWAAVLLVAVVTAVYANSFRGVMLLDDRYIEKTPSLSDPALWRELKKSSRPLVDLSFAINRQIGGFEPLGYHVFNLLVHLAATLALYGLVRRSLAAPGVMRAGIPADSGGNTGFSHQLTAMTIALLWALHPLQTQSVTYISQRAESMMGLFYLLTLYGVARAAAADRSTPWQAAAVAACALGMLCKQVMVTAPAVAILYDRAFWSSSWKETLAKRWRLHAGLFATLGILLVMGVGRGLVGDKGGEVGFGVASITPKQYLFTQFGVVLHYLTLAFWPAGLCLDHQWPIAQSMAQSAVPASIVAILLALTAWAWLRRPAAGFLGVAFFAILLPTSSFIPIKDVIFEHRMYLPLAAVVAAAVFGGQWLVRQIAAEAGPRRRIEIGLVATIALALAVRTHIRNRDYASAEQMWASVVARYPGSARALTNLSAAYIDEGKLADAEQYSRRAVAANPSLNEAQYNLGHVLMLTGRSDEAIDHLSKAARSAEAFPDALIDLGTIFAAKGRLDAAISCFHDAIRAQPDNADAHFNLGCALRAKGENDKANIEFGEVLRLRPEDTEAFKQRVATDRHGKD